MVPRRGVADKQARHIHWKVGRTDVKPVVLSSACLYVYVLQVCARSCIQSTHHVPLQLPTPAVA
jgi:hypothetical protein